MHSSDFEVYFLQLLPPTSSLVCVFLTRITKLKTTHRSDRLSHITRAINNAGPSVCDFPGPALPKHVIIFSILSVIFPDSGEAMSHLKCSQNTDGSSQSNFEGKVL